MNVRGRPVSDGHNKLDQYRADPKINDPDLKHLYVALFPIAEWGLRGELSPVEDAWIRCVERLLIWKYADTWIEKPKLNDIDRTRAAKKGAAVKAAKKKAAREAEKEAQTKKKAEALARFKAHREGLS